MHCGLRHRPCIFTASPSSSLCSTRQPLRRLGRQHPAPFQLFLQRLPTAAAATTHDGGMASPQQHAAKQPALRTLTSLVAEQAQGEGAADMVLLFSTLQVAVKTISSAIARAGIDGLNGVYEEAGGAQAAAGGDRDQQKTLDVVAVRAYAYLLCSCLRAYFDVCMGLCSWVARPCLGPAARSREGPQTTRAKHAHYHARRTTS